jgi:hypothetical protein
MHSILIILMKIIDTETAAYLTGLAKSVFSIWLVAWMIRRGNDIDVRLNRLEQYIRWLVVTVAFVCVLPSGSSFEAIRVGGGVIGIAFLVWPNLGHHTVELFRKKESRDNNTDL